MTEHALGEFLREHADGIDYESLNRETQIYLVDLGYPGAGEGGVSQECKANPR